MTTDDQANTLSQRHLRFGWVALSCFVCLGITLEVMHAFKVGWYLDVHNETRRLMWTLAHAHGVLLALVNIAFAFTVLHAREMRAPRRRLASLTLLSASVMLPAGFFLGGLVIYAGDPGLGILLLPPGAALMLVAVLVTAIEVLRGRE